MPMPQNALCRRAALRLAATFVLCTLCPLPAQAGDCAPGNTAVGTCQETPRFSATLTDFRVLQTGNANRPLSATLRLRNKTAEPLTLVYVDGSAAALDDQGQRYTMQNTRSGLRGLGVATRREFDPRFTLAPGEAADVRLEVSAFIRGVYGTVFDFDFAVREVESLPGGQHRLGRETVLRFAALRDGSGQGAAAAVAPRATAAAGDPATTVGAPAVSAEACRGQPNCVVNGPLAAQVERLQPEAVKGNNQGIVVTVSFRNLSAAPMILNYKQSTGTLLDNHGQRYTVDSRRASDVQGMPVSTRAKASSQFTLAPGESRQAQFRYTRFVGKTPVGTAFSPALAVEQYELLPSNQLRLVREYALDFGAVSGIAGASGASAQDLQRALQSLGDLFKK
ncbi:MAG TPA: hypothetical protein VK876_12615 [Rubrivivax sp.]|nr:hypothetical protein [Rubrivivax sp.]